MAPNQQTRAALEYENDDVGRISAYERKGYRTYLILYVNGRRVSDQLCRQARPNQTLLSFLRDVVGLTGSKLGCAEGGCGACTVMITKPKPPANGDTAGGKNLHHYSVNACLMPVLAADGCHVTTIEGIGQVKKNQLHPVQHAMVDMHGSQCGYCTPGIIVSIYALLANNPKVSYLEEHLDGNLCRCTGYRPIWDAARSLCDDAVEEVRGPCGIPCRECPDRDTCTEECSVNEKKNTQPQQQEDNVKEIEETAECGSSVMCTSSSEDKMAEYKDTFLADPSWREQPDQIVPTELSDATSAVRAELRKPLVVVDRGSGTRPSGGTWFKPTTLTELLSLVNEFSPSPSSPSPSGAAYKIVVGNTEVGIETRFKHAVYPRLVSPSESITELFGIEADATHLVIGSCCPLGTIQDACGSLGKRVQETLSLSRTCMPIHDMLRWFASTQIRNVACLGGNLVTASPISDMNPMLASMDAKLVICKLGGTTDDDDGAATIARRSVSVSDFFLRYRVVDLLPSEIVERIEVPILRPYFEYLKPFKQARRREDDISIVTSGMRIRLAIRDGKFAIEDAALAFGGMAPKTVRATRTEQALIGSEFCTETFTNAAATLVEELNLHEAVPGGQAAYRMTLASSFLYKFFLSCVQELKTDVEAMKADPTKYPDINASDIPPIPAIDDSEVSGTSNFLSEAKPRYSGVQVFPKAKCATGLEDKLHPTTGKVPSKRAAAEAATVGKPSTHLSGPLHCTGEALYTDDIPVPPGTLQASLVQSNQCGSVFESIDVSAALQIPGVHAVYTHTDLVALGGNNAIGPVVHDETVFLPLGEKIRTVGQVLGICIAESLDSAEVGARAVEVKYGEVVEKPIVSIQDAIEASSYYDDFILKLKRGDVSLLDKTVEAPDTVGTPAIGDVVKVSGTFSSGAQEHFYLEPGSSLVVPSESDTNLTIYCSTQAPNETQMHCALATGTPASKVVVRMKRMGGGFGGKETRTAFASCAAAVAAKSSGRPVRLTLPRSVDMQTTGTRHAFMSKYCASAQITEDGVKLLSLDVKLYANAGCGLDLTAPVLGRAVLHVDGVYNFPHFRAEAYPCKTVQPPHTAFRGFGGPQGMAVCEHVMDHLALACGVSKDTLRRSNMYKDGDEVTYGMIIGEQDSGIWNIPSMWDRLYSELDVPGRRARIDEFNAKHKWLKRGLAFVPTKFGIAYTAKFMNQGGALVHVYTDGTVLVSHGGTEMGQGLHTKVCQVAAQAFGIPLEDVYVNDTSTDKVANSIATAASSSTDLYGMATLDACRQILKRLEPIRESLGSDATLKEIATAAFFARIDLSAHGFYAISDSRCGFDFNKEKPADYPADKPENTWKGHPFNYYTQGVACSEVEVDVLTGNHRTLRSDVLVDVGASINPMIDIGQIEGAFTQGMGWSTIEDVMYADDDHTWIRPRGIVFTSGPGTYKIPAFNDVPEIFNISLLEKASNPLAVHSSKAIGEPPFFLGSSVFYAIKDAVCAARKQNLGKEEYFEMRMPATSERIRMYTADPLGTTAISKMPGRVESSEVYQPQGSY